MKFKTKEHTVDAMHVSQVVSLANTNFKFLPTWFKKKYQEGKIFIGSSGVVVNDVYHCVLSEKDSVLVLDQNKELDLMPEKEFNERYQDYFDSTSSGIHEAGVDLDNLDMSGTYILNEGERVVGVAIHSNLSDWLKAK